MSNKTQLQTNNSKLTSLIAELQGKAAGGGSGEGASIVTGTLTITDEGMYEPMQNKYIFSSENFSPKSYHIIILLLKKNSQLCRCAIHNNGSTIDSFTAFGIVDNNYGFENFPVSQMKIQQNSISVVLPSAATYTDASFIAC